MKGLLTRNKEEIKNLTIIEDIDIPDSLSNRAHYSWDVVDVILEESQNPEKEVFRPILIQAWKELCSVNINLRMKFSIINSDESLIFQSNKYLSIKNAQESIVNSEEQPKMNKYYEIGYIETGEEEKIALEASNSRPYTDFFEEFVPNTKKESERAHKYTVSLHKAIWYKENLELFRKFDLIRFGKERVKGDFDTFLTNSCLYDPRDPHFSNTTTYLGENKPDENRAFKDEGVYPEFYGSYHIHHRIDGKLIAINVWDITENTLSSVYTFYDPEYSFLSLGHVTAVREMEYMMKIRNEYNPNMRFYYMGEYVWNSSK